jgi:monoamine oxidase
LAEPLDARLFFAGEATSTEFYSTAHGAHLTGIETAREVARSLEKRV